VAVQSDGAIVSYEAAGPAPRVQSKTTGKGVLVGVESPWGLLLLVHLVCPLPAYHRGRLWGRPQSLSKHCTWLPTAYASLRLPAAGECQRSV